MPVFWLYQQYIGFYKPLEVSVSLIISWYLLEQDDDKVQNLLYILLIIT
jgi:hypothetical protein